MQYDVDWELIRRATETVFQPGDLSLTTAFQTLGWMEVDDGLKPPPPPTIQDVPETETPQAPRPVHPSTTWSNYEGDQGRDASNVSGDTTIA